MKIILTTQESEDIFFDALCNGLSYVCGYGFEIDFSRKDYAKAKDNTSNAAFEEVLMQILRDGGTITLADVVNDGSETSTITLQEVHDRVSDVDARVLIEAINEDGDADTADAVLQTVFFKEITFG
jgi:urease gamma subunit